MAIVSLSHNSDIGIGIASIVTTLLVAVKNSVIAQNMVISTGRCAKSCVRMEV
jgi:hypothetical protein